MSEKRSITNEEIAYGLERLRESFERASASFIRSIREEFDPEEHIFTHSDEKVLHLRGSFKHLCIRFRSQVPSATFAKN